DNQRSMRSSGKAPPKDRPALERFVRGEVRRGDDKNGAKERAGSHQALHVAEQIIEETVPQGDKSLIFRRPVGADFKGAYKEKGSSTYDTASMAALAASAFKPLRTERGTSSGAAKVVAKT